VSRLDSKEKLGSSPAVFARELLARIELRSAGDLSVLTSRLGLTVKEVESDGFEGVLVCRADRRKGIIAINSGIREDGRKRFAVCHEIGHFVLPGHGVDGCICKSEDIESWRKGAPEHEIEANEFASELLLPYKEVQPFVKKDLTIALAKKVCQEFRASLTATCLKCVEVTEEKCAVVVSVAGYIKWFRRNEKFGYFVRVNQEVGEESYAAQLFTGTHVEEPFGAVPADAWIEAETLPADARIWEDSILLPYYNSTITILTIHKQLSSRAES
jgi:hypothetical protein